MFKSTGAEPSGPVGLINKDGSSEAIFMPTRRSSRCSSCRNLATVKDESPAFPGILGVLLLKAYAAGFEVDALIDHGLCVDISHRSEFVAVRFNQSHSLVIDLSDIGFVFSVHGPECLALLIVELHGLSEGRASTSDSEPHVPSRQQRRRP
jgi:hypothetical protein